MGVYCNLWMWHVGQDDIDGLLQDCGSSTAGVPEVLRRAVDINITDYDIETFSRKKAELPWFCLPQGCSPFVALSRNPYMTGCMTCMWLPASGAGFTIIMSYCQRGYSSTEEKEEHCHNFTWCWGLINTCQQLLTHCGLVTSYGDRDLGHHWLR